MSKDAVSIQESDSVINVVKTSVPRPRSSSSFLPSAQLPLVTGSQRITNTTKPLVQPKLKIGQPNDEYEQEADRVAEQVMRMPSSQVSSWHSNDDPKIQRQNDEEEEEEEALQTKPIADAITPVVQRQAGEEEETEEEEIQASPLGTSTSQILQRQTSDNEGSLRAKSKAGRLLTSSPNLENSIKGIKNGGNQLSGEERSYFEPRFGIGLDHVRIHTDGRAAKISQAINAKAFTLNNNIAFNSGYYSPASRDGKRLLAHELTHVIQQTGARQGTLHGGGKAGSGGGVSVSKGSSTDVVRRNIKSNLREAMSGWGTDEQRIYQLLRNASQPEKDAVRGDPVLMAELQSDLTRTEWGYVLGYLNMPLETRIREASSGWGTDEANINAAVRYASIPHLRGLMLNGPLLSELRDELNENELGLVMGIVADKFTSDAAATAEEAYHALMLFPDAIQKACDVYVGLRGNTFQIALTNHLNPGNNMTAQTVSDVNNHIGNDDNRNRILASFRRRWSVTATTDALGGGTAPTWTVDRIRTMHGALQQMPAGHITRAGQNIAELQYATGMTAAGTWQGGAGRLRISTTTSGVRGVVRHEVGHSIDDRLGATSIAFKRDAPNLWRWGNADIWENNMANPWRRHSSGNVTAAHQTAIKNMLNNYVNSPGTQSLWDFAGAGHDVRTYWNDRVPIIEAAKSIAGFGKRVYAHPNRIKRNNNKRFSWSIHYQRFHCYSNLVWQQRVSLYSLNSHRDFFAELYEHYYAEGRGNERLQRLSRVPAWQTFFDTRVHPIA